MRKRHTEILECIRHGFKEELDRVGMGWLNLMVELGGRDTCMPSIPWVSWKTLTKRARSDFPQGPRSRGSASWHTSLDIRKVLFATTVTEKDGTNYGALPAELVADSPYLLERGL
jgi:hypothetical protein